MTTLFLFVFTLNADCVVRQKKEQDRLNRAAEKSGIFSVHVGSYVSFEEDSMKISISSTAYRSSGCQEVHVFEIPPLKELKP